MKYIKTFENYSEPQDITQDIADDLLPKVQKMRQEKGSLTIDLVMSNLVDMGFDFDIEEEEDDDDDWSLINIKNNFY